jgi:hypothetical protein
VDDAVEGRHLRDGFGVSPWLPPERNVRVTLREHAVEATATLPDGRVVHVRVGLVEDSYLRSSDVATVDVTLYDGSEHLAAVNTVLDPEQTSAARELATEIVRGLESGDLEPTAGAIEPLADRLRG